MSKKKYFPNNWQAYKDADDEMFISHTFDDLMDWKVANWELPDSVCCLIRVQDVETHKVTEYVHQSKGSAYKHLKRLMNTPKIDITVCDHNSVQNYTDA